MEKEALYLFEIKTLMKIHRVWTKRARNGRDIGRTKGKARLGHYHLVFRYSYRTEQQYQCDFQSRLKNETVSSLETTGYFVALAAM